MKHLLGLVVALGLLIFLTGCAESDGHVDYRKHLVADDAMFQLDSSNWAQINVNSDGTWENTGGIYLTELPAIGRTLIGGRPALSGEFPATVYASMSSARCSANVIGPRVLIIAAHCVGEGKTASFNIKGVGYNSVCNRAPQYSTNPTADWALCKVSTDIKDVPYENINMDPERVKVGDEVTLTGYGCVNPGGGGGNDGILRVGIAKAIRVPRAADYDIVTQGDAALCYGDSGGPAYVYFGPDKKDRVQVSINSRGDIRTTSYLSSTANDTFKGFIQGWATGNGNLQVCGVSGPTTGCRGAEGPGPGEGQLPAWCGSAQSILQECIFGTPPKAKADFEACKEQYANLFACLEMAASL